MARLYQIKVIATTGGGGGGGTPGGSNTQVQYNNSGAFGGISGVTSNGSTLSFADNISALFGTTNPFSLTSAQAGAGTYNVMTVGTLSKAPILVFTTEENKAFDFIGGDPTGLLQNPILIFTSENQALNQYTIFQMRGNSGSPEFDFQGSSGDSILGSPLNGNGTTLRFESGSGGTAGGIPGDVYFKAGEAKSGDSDGGNINLDVGVGHGTGTPGYISPGGQTNFRFLANGAVKFFGPSFASVNIFHNGTDGLLSSSTGNILLNTGLGNSTSSATALTFVNPILLNTGATGTNWLELGDGQTAAVSAATALRLRYNGSNNHFEASLNGAAYTNVLGSSSPGGASLAVQFNNSGAFGGVAIGTAGQMLVVNGGATGYQFSTPITSDGTLTTGFVPFFNINNTRMGASGLFYDALNTRLGFFSVSPAVSLHFVGQERHDIVSNLGSSFFVQDFVTTAQYIGIDTTTGTEAITFGSTVVNPVYNFKGNQQANFETRIWAKNKLFWTQAVIASANNLTLGNGNVQEVTGATQINLIDSTGWITGALVILAFDSNPLVKNGQTVSGSNLPIRLAGSVDFTAAAGSKLTLLFTGATFDEVSRTVL